MTKEHYGVQVGNLVFVRWNECEAILTHVELGWEFEACKFATLEKAQENADILGGCVITIKGSM